MINDENYVAIQGWMVNNLGLKGNALFVYAIIYGFSQDGEQWFNGSRQYLADWTASTKRGVDKNLKTLLDMGLIEKKETMIKGVTFVQYRVTKFTGGGEQSSPGGRTKFTGGGELSSPNNIDNNIDKNIENNNREIKHRHGEYDNVLLTDDEYNKLINEYPDIEKRIDRLSEYIASTGKKYKSHYATIRSWARKDRGTKSELTNDLERIASWAERSEDGQTGIW